VAKVAAISQQAAVNFGQGCGFSSGTFDFQPASFLANFWIDLDNEEVKAT
jgi:hypothetical protein